MGINNPTHGCRDAQERHKGKDSAERLTCHFLFLLLCAAVGTDQHHVEAKRHGIHGTGTGHCCLGSSGRGRAWGIYCAQNCVPKVVAHASRKPAGRILASVETLDEYCLWPPEQTCTFGVRGREAI